MPKGIIVLPLAASCLVEISKTGRLQNEFLSIRFIGSVRRPSMKENNNKKNQRTNVAGVFGSLSFRNCRNLGNALDTGWFVISQGIPSQFLFVCVCFCFPNPYHNGVESLSLLLLVFSQC